MALGDVNESQNINHQQEVIQDTAAIVFAGIDIKHLSERLNPLLLPSWG
jgi:hypothetical protein